MIIPFKGTFEMIPATLLLLHRADTFQFIIVVSMYFIKRIYCISSLSLIALKDMNQHILLKFKTA